MPPKTQSRGNVTNKKVVSDATTEELHPGFGDIVEGVTTAWVDGDRVYLGGFRVVSEWDLTTSLRVRSFKGAHSDCVWAVCVSGDDLFTASSHYTVVQWSLESGEQIRTFTDELRAESNPGLGHLWALDVTEGMIFAGAADWVARKWDVETGALAQVFCGHQGWVTSVAVVPAVYTLQTTAPQLCTASTDGTMKLWDTDNGECLHTFEHGPHVLSLVPWQASILGGCQDGETWRWSMGSGVLQTRYPGHTDCVVSLAVDAKYVYTGSLDATVMRFSHDSQECTGVLNTQGSNVTALCIWKDKLLVACDRVYEESEVLIVGEDSVAWQKPPTAGSATEKKSPRGTNKKRGKSEVGDLVGRNEAKKSKTKVTGGEDEDEAQGERAAQRSKRAMRGNEGKGNEGTGNEGKGNEAPESPNDGRKSEAKEAKKGEEFPAQPARKVTATAKKQKTSDLEGKKGKAEHAAENKKSKATNGMEKAAVKRRASVDMGNKGENKAEGKAEDKVELKQDKAAKVEADKGPRHKKGAALKPNGAKAQVEQWVEQGHPLIGSFVRRFFDDRFVDGKVVAYLPPGSGPTEPALWRVRHDDGDEEDLDEGELGESIKAFEKSNKEKKPERLLRETDDVLAYDDDMLYDARILEIDASNTPEEHRYMVHYVGWNDKYDRWLEPSKVLLKTRAAIKLQQKLKDEAQALGKKVRR